MAKAKRTKSGKWRCLVYSHTDENGKRKYESFTAPTKKEAEFAAAKFAFEKREASDPGRWELGFAIDRYISLKEPTLSPSTIAAYRKIRKYAFQDIMQIPIGKLTATMLQEAVNREMLRKPKQKAGSLSPKTIKNQYGLISSTLSTFMPDRVYKVTLPKKARRIRDLPLPEDIIKAVKGTDMELPVLLALWLSFTESEIRGLTKSKSIDGDYITIREVVVTVNGADVRKDVAKEETRIRRHRMPVYVRELIEGIEGDIIVDMPSKTILRRFKRYMARAGLPEITFHDLRHVNASLMAKLRIPDKYAQERGGWKTDHIMKTVYTETFSEERERVDSIIDNYFESCI